ncbi:MAG: hypothetical protein IJL97_02225, partial [Lachnospiraceae bacterium]|nr:hypothetical protein [Lachnospiraceae bacterium]
YNLKSGYKADSEYAKKDMVPGEICTRCATGVMGVYEPIYVVQPGIASWYELNKIERSLNTYFNRVPSLAPIPKKTIFRTITFQIEDPEIALLYKTIPFNYTDQDTSYESIELTYDQFIYHGGGYYGTDRFYYHSDYTIMPVVTDAEPESTRLIISIENLSGEIVKTYIDIVPYTEPIP